MSKEDRRLTTFTKDTLGNLFFGIDVDVMERLSRDRGESHDGSHMTAVT